MSSLVPATVSSVSSLTRIPNVGVQPWSLHSLLLVIEAAGLSYLSHVQVKKITVLKNCCLIMLGLFMMGFLGFLVSNFSSLSIS